MNSPIAWDSSVWFALLKQEPGPYLSFINSIAEEVDDGTVDLWVPVVVIAELSYGESTALKQGVFRKVQQFLEKSNVVVCDLTQASATLSGALRHTVRTRQLTIMPYRRLLAPPTFVHLRR